MITEAKRAELDAVAAVRAIPASPPQKPVTLQSLDERVTALELAAKKSEESNG